jgi:hypothetical protein
VLSGLAELAEATADRELLERVRLAMGKSVVLNHRKLLLSI